MLLLQTLLRGKDNSSSLRTPPSYVLVAFVEPWISGYVKYSSPLKSPFYQKRHSRDTSNTIDSRHQ